MISVRRGGLVSSVVLIFAPSWTPTGASSLRGSFTGAMLPWKEICRLSFAAISPLAIETTASRLRAATAASMPPLSDIRLRMA